MYFIVNVITEFVMPCDNRAASWRILFLSRLQTGSGNKSTLDRIRRYFDESGHKCISVHTDDVKCFDDIKQENVKYRFHAAIGLHAHHAGQWLKDLGCPYILMFGGTDLNECSTDMTKLKVMTEAIEQARYLVTFNEHMVHQADLLWPGLKNDPKLKIIPQGITVSPAVETSSVCQHYNIPAEATILTMVGAIRPVKDQLYLLDAFNAWHQNSKIPVYLTIIGPVMDKGYGQTVMSIVKNSPGLLYLGSLSLQDTHSLIQESFALVNSSQSEGQATAILEAQALGTVVIVRDIPSNRDIVQHRKTGLIYSTPQEFLQQLECLINDRSLRQQLIDNAKEYVHSKHNYQSEKATYLELVSQIV